MKVIYVCAKSYYFTKGYRGRVIHAKGIVEGLLANGCEVEVLSGLGTSNFLDEHDKLTVTSVGERISNPFYEVLWRKKILRYLKKKIDKFDLLILRYGFSNPLLSLKIAKIAHKNNCRSVIEVNSLGSDYKNKIKLFRGLVKRLEINVLSYFDIVYVVNKEEKRRIEEIRNDLNIVAIPNATHNRTIASESESDLVRFVYLGRLNHYYNFEEIIKNFKTIRNAVNEKVELVIYGYGSNDALLNQNATMNSSIKMMGKYDNNRITELVNRDTDILLLPYKKDTVAEIGSPMKLFEYLILGAPILASNIGQIIYTINHQKNGYIYDSGNSTDLLDKMKHVINYKEERKKVGLKAHKEAVNKHNWKNRMDTLITSIGN